MKLLVIGGTVFLGRHIVSQALAAGHEVTVLNRGTNILEEQSAAQHLIADRESNLEVLAGRKFDAVIDTCGYKPEVVRKSAEALSKSTDNYIFVSTISVYGEFPKPGITESDQIKYTPQGEEGNYGSLKADCEKVVIEVFPDKSLIIRPGLIVGPFDQSDRFTYWPARILAGGRILAPGRPSRAVQFINVRDLAAWILKLAESGQHGVFNATGPREKLTMQQFLTTCQETIVSKSELVWINDDVLLIAEIQPWIQLPLWIPHNDLDNIGFMQLDCSKAFQAGLTIRPLGETIIDVLSWDRTRDSSLPRKAGLSLERESELLKTHF